MIIGIKQNELLKNCAARVFTKIFPLWPKMKEDKLRKHAWEGENKGIQLLRV